MKRCGSSVFGSSRHTKRRRTEEKCEVNFDSSSDEEDEKSAAVELYEEPEYPLHVISIEIDLDELQKVSMKSSEEKEAFLASKHEDPDEFYLWEVLIYGLLVHANNSPGSRTGLHVAGRQRSPVLDKFRRAEINTSKIRVKVSSAFAHQCDGKKQTNLLEISLEDQIRAVVAELPQRHQKQTKRVHCQKRYSFVRRGRRHVGVCLWWGTRPGRTYLEAAFLLEEPKGGGNGKGFAQRGRIPAEDVLVVTLGNILFVEEPMIGAARG